MKIHEMYNQTLIYVTHDQIEAMTVGQRIALMNQGKLQMLDTPSNVYHRPANVFTAKFIGSPSMNITETSYIDGQLKIGDQWIALPGYVEETDRKTEFGQTVLWYPPGACETFYPEA